MARFGHTVRGLVFLIPGVTCAAPGMAQAKYVPDNLAAVRGRLPEAKERKRMETFIDGL